ncbi:MAG: hemerythrin domain-containing protein [Gammaproteobacteria bacterium]|nr:hemerythrin domain-containing protein [Gammaproteobacteria bacterium]
MSTITEDMSADHRRCDGLFAEAETLISNSDWDQGRLKFEEFRSNTEQHFKREEEVLFPTFEQVTGQTMGPTQIMRSEHAQMRQLFEDMAAAVEKQDQDDFLGFSETLMMVMQQHNMKEEQILYRMSDQVLGAQAAEILKKMADVA